MSRGGAAGLVLAAWSDFDRVLAGLSSEQAIDASAGSSFAWTLAHATNQLDAWINVRFLRRSPHPLIGQQRFRIGGNGIAESWDAIRQAVDETRDAARVYLSEIDAAADLVIAYDGSLLELRQPGLSLHYALARIAAHHYFHIGEIASKRDALGDAVGDYPGRLEECLPQSPAAPRPAPTGGGPHGKRSHGED